MAMYKEYLMEKEEVSEEDFAEFLEANMGVLKEIGSTLCVRAEDFDEYQQLAYFAVKKAVEDWRSKRSFSLLAYLRMCLRHEYFMYGLRMHYPVRLPSSGYQGYVSYTSVPLEIEITYLEEGYRKKEDRLLSYVIWECVKKRCTEMEYRILVLRYKEEKGYKEIAMMLKCNYSTVKAKAFHALHKLRGVRKLKDIARNVYGMKRA